MEFLSTPSARRATRHLKKDVLPNLKISIHALREEGDLPMVTSSHVRTNFYPRPPRGGRHLQKRGFKRRMVISIHALREEGDHAVAAALGLSIISIHALREEGDS